MNKACRKGLAAKISDTFMQTNFLLGEIKMTAKVRETLGRIPFDLVARHAVNDHGIITVREARGNKLSMQTMGAPIISRYRVNPTDPLTKFVRVETSARWVDTLISIE